MKTTFWILSFLLMAGTSFASDEKYGQQMTKYIDMLYQGKTLDDLQQGVNGMERIAAAEKTKWEPYYYATWGYIIMANREPDGAKKDVYLDQAMVDLAKAKNINSNESELEALEGFAYMIRVTVDPATRGQKFSPMAYQAYQKSLAINPENPRALGLLAQLQFGTARFFGTATTEACATTKAASDKFKTYASTNPLAPRWGKEMVEGLLSQCK